VWWGVGLWLHPLAGPVAGLAVAVLLLRWFKAADGRLYAYYLILKAFRQDFSRIIKERELGPAWDQMLGSMRTAAVLQPFVVVNGAPDSQFMPSHLATQGFYLLRARTQLKEIGNILLK